MKKYILFALIIGIIYSIPVCATIKRDTIKELGNGVSINALDGTWQNATIQDVDELVKSGDLKLIKNMNEDDYYDVKSTALYEALTHFAPLDVIQYLIDLGERAEKIDPERIFDDYKNFDKEEEENLVSEFNKLVASKCPELVLHTDATERMPISVFEFYASYSHISECAGEDAAENFYQTIDNYMKPKRLKLVKMLKAGGMKLDEAFFKTIERMNKYQHGDDRKYLKANREYLQFLIQAGADVNTISYYPKTPLDMIESFEEQDVETVKVLKDAGAKNFDREVVLESDKVLWKTDLDYYDTNGHPYTGKVFEWGLGKVLLEKDVENGKVIKTKECFENLCMISDKKRKIEQVIDLSGKPFNGMRNEKAQKLDDGISKVGYIGNYINGYPDGLHKILSGRLTQEIMYKMGKVISKKAYEEDGKSYYEEIHDETGIKTKSLKDGILESEKAFDKDENPIFIKNYSNGILQDEQIFNPDGSSVITFSDGRKLTLTNKQKRDIFEPEKITDKDLNDMGLHFKSKKIVHGNKILCKIAYPRKGFKPDDWDEGCYRQFKSLKEWGFPDISLTDKQKEELYYHPGRFFEKNELKLDMSEVNVDITKGTLDTKDITKSLDKLANDIKDSFSEILPVGE